MGIPAALFVTFMTAGLPVERPRLLKGPSRFLWFVYYVAVFVWECVKANIDVAYRVIHPGLPLRPGTVRVRTELRSDIGLTILANSITLTPGMTSVDIDKENGSLYIHRLYISEEEAATESMPAVVGRFEKILKRIFE